MDTYDLIIIGSGAAGLRAGVHAQTNGFKSVILEKRRTTGGNTRISDGGVAASGTDLQTAAGIDDSPEAMKADMLEAGLHKNDEALVDAIVEDAKDAFEWTREIGVPYDGTVLKFGGHSVRRCYTPESVSGRTLVRKGEAAYLDSGGTILKEASVESLIQEDGAVCGVRYKDAEGTLHPLRARKGVLIASGGFGADQGFLKDINEAYATLETTNVTSATAEVLKQAMAIGADTVDLREIQIAPWTSPKEKGFGHAPKFGDYIALPKGMLVDPKTASRFVNELADRKTVGEAILKIEHPAIALADSKAVQAASVDISKALKNGSVRKFDSLNALAKATDMDPDALKASVERFNRAISGGRDDAFGKPLDETVPIDTPPYYMMEVWPKVHHTMGGLRIDADGKVLAKDARPIPGLFAAGEATGGIHGASRLGSCALTDALVMGRRAARSALEK